VARNVALAIHAQLSDCERLIRAFQSVFLATDEVSYEEFNQVYENLRNDRARVNLQALGYAKRIAMVDGDHFITTMFAPTFGNEVIRGLDVNRQPNNLRAVLESRDTNLVRMSPPFTLRQSGPAAGLDGFIVRLPVYAAGSAPRTVGERRKALVGSLGASFRTRDLIGSVMPTSNDVVVEVVVNDISNGTSRLLHRHSGGTAVAESARRHEERVRFGGRTWVVIVTEAPRAAGPPWWASTFWLGMLASGLLAALSWSLVSMRGRAILLAQAMSERFRASEERFRRLNELLPSLVLVARCSDGRILYLNAAARERLGELTELRSLDGLFDQEGFGALFAQTHAASQTSDLLMLPVTQEPFWANVCVSSIEFEDVPTWLIVANDISEQRRMTERLSYQASHDSLTKQLNRREFEARVGNALGSSGAADCALLFIDLD